MRESASGLAAICLGGSLPNRSIYPPSKDSSSLEPEFLSEEQRDPFGKLLLSLGTRRALAGVFLISHEAVRSQGLLWPTVRSSACKPDASIGSQQ